MNATHLALVVEDDLDAFEEHRLALAVHGIRAFHVNNKRDALIAIDERDFCLLLVDLEIKPEPDDFRGHVSAGYEVIRHARSLFPKRSSNGECQLQIIVVSGHLHDLQHAREAVQAGANDWAAKRLDEDRLPDRIKACMTKSGRDSHESCVSLSRTSTRSTAEGPPVLDVTGQPDPNRRQRSIVALGANLVSVTDGSLLTLMRLFVAKRSGRRLHTDRDFGSLKRAHGARLVSRLNAELREVFKGDIVENARGGWYVLSDQLLLGVCDVARLQDLKNQQILDLAEEAEELRTTKKKV